MKKSFIFIVCLFIFPIVTNAASSCNTATMSNISSLANNVNIVYEVDSSSKVPVFTITLSNLTSDMIVFDKNLGKTYKGFANTGSEISIKTKTSGSYSFVIYSKQCKEQVATKSVSLPTYNVYYGDKLCDGLDTCEVCQKWYGSNSDRQTFERGIQECKKKQNVVVEEEEEHTKQERSWYETIADIFLKYWWAIIILMIIIIGIYYAIRTKQKKNEYNFKV